MTLQMIFLSWEVLEGSVLHTTLTSSNRTIVILQPAFMLLLVECGWANTIAGTILFYFDLPELGESM